MLFIPFLQMLFLNQDKVEKAVKPVYEGGFVRFFEYAADYYEYFRISLTAENPKKALLFVCVSVLIAFLLKNIFREM